MINCAVVGLRFGKNILPRLLLAENASLFCLKGVYDLKKDVTNEVANEFGVKAYESLDELLACPDISAVLLFTPPHTRPSLISSILESGKHVLTTKPFAMNAKETKHVLDIALQKKLIVHANSPTPTLPNDIAVIENWIKNEPLGRPISVSCDIHASYFEKEDGSWYDDKRLCPVAPMFRLGIYLINELVRLFGTCQSVFVSESTIRTLRKTPDNAMLSMSFSSGVLCNVLASFCVDDGKKYANEMTIRFEHGSIYKNTAPCLSVDERHESELTLVLVDKDGNKTQKTECVTGVAGEYDFASFSKCIANHASVELSTYYDLVVHATQVMQAMQQSEETGLPVIL